MISHPGSPTVLLAFIFLAAGCTSSPQDGVGVAVATGETIDRAPTVWSEPAAAEATAEPAVASSARRLPLEDIAVPATFDIAEGAFTQGGWVRGRAPAGTVSLMLDDTPVPTDAEGQFFAAFDRDASATATLVARLDSGRIVEQALAVEPRDWNIERVNVARRPGGPSAAFLARRRPELEAIGAARARDTGAEGWKQDFIWPVRGRISGRFGSQRIYRGEPGSYHTGLDIAPGAGTPFVAPADGVVVLAESDFSLEGRLLIIDHGNGLNSAFLHASRLLVSEGDKVRQGEHIGDVGASGRATGPHLHWGLKWRDARLDPLLFVDPDA